MLNLKELEKHMLTRKSFSLVSLVFVLMLGALPVWAAQPDVTGVTNGAPGQTVTITGTGFDDKINAADATNTSRVNGVFFSDSNGNQNVSAAGFTIVSNTSITATVPNNAFTGPVRVTDPEGEDTSSPDDSVILPRVTSFSPQNGIGPQGNNTNLATTVTISGSHFSDDNSPVTAVLFNGVRQTSFVVDPDINGVSDPNGPGTQIVAKVPQGATTGPISIEVNDPDSGTNVVGPNSTQTFTINNITEGGLTFPNSFSFLVAEDATLPVGDTSYTLALKRAEQTNNGTTDVPPSQAITARITVSATATTSSPRISVTRNANPNFDPADTDTFMGSGTIVDVTFRGEVFDTFDVSLIDAGDDSTTGTQTITISAVITDGDPNYQNGRTSNSVVGSRADLHAIIVDTSTVARTTERDVQNGTFFEFDVELNRAGPAGRTGATDPGFPQVQGNPDYENPDGTTNTDPYPKTDVLLQAKVNPPTTPPPGGGDLEGLIQYYVFDEDNDAGGPDTAHGLVAVQPIPQQFQTLLYAIDVTSNEYYRNRHIMRVIGQDDSAADGDRSYTITFSNIFSNDPEYANLAATPAVTLVNTDDETNTNVTDQPGFLFSPPNRAGQPKTFAAPPSGTLITSESGSSTIFTVKLNQKPTANVTLTLTSDDLTEGQLIAPGQTVPANSIQLIFTPEAPTTGEFGNPVPGNVKRWDIEQTVTVKGVDDAIQDGSQDYVILTSTSSADTTYNQIDPPDPVVTNTDNESPGVTVTPTFLVVQEGVTGNAGIGTFQVVLNLQPTSDVFISLAAQPSADGQTRATLDKQQLKFTSQNWNTPQTVTVTAVPDSADNTDKTIVVTTGAAASADQNYNNLAVSDVSVLILNTPVAGFTIQPNTGLVTTEAGASGQKTFTVHLNTAPTANVTLPLSTSDNTEGRIFNTQTQTLSDTLTLTFTPQNFNTDQTVTVRGVNDQVADGNVAYSIITGKPTSGDSNYNNLTAANVVDVSLINQDDETANVLLTPSSGLVTNENGLQAFFNVALSTQPTGNVVITPTSTNPNEGTVSPASLTFTGGPNGNWRVPQRVTVTGKDDAVKDGNIDYSIAFSVTSSDPAYSGITVQEVTAVNNDNEATTISIVRTAPTPINNPIVEGDTGTDTSVTFNVTLSLQSAQPVTVKVDTVPGSASAGSDFTPLSQTLTFDPGQTSKTVTVTVLGDDIAEPDESFGVNLSTATNASIANGLVSVTIKDDDGPGPRGVTTVDLNGLDGTGKNFFGVWNQAADVKTRITDVDALVDNTLDPTIQKITITIKDSTPNNLVNSGLQDGLSEKLTAKAIPGVTVTPADGTGGVLTLQGPASEATFTTVLRSVRYENTESNPSSDLREFLIEVFADTDAVPDATAISRITHNTGAGTDTDGDGTPDTNDNDDDGDGISDADEQAIDSDNDGIPDDQDPDDDNNGIPDVNEDSAYLDLNGPVLTGQDFLTTWIQSGATPLADPKAILADDNDAVQSLIIRISDPQDGDVEKLDANVIGSGISKVYDAPTHTLTLTPTAPATTATALQFQQVLRTVTYINPGTTTTSTGGTGTGTGTGTTTTKKVVHGKSRTFQFALDGGGGQSSTATTTINVNGNLGILTVESSFTGNAGTLVYRLTNNSSDTWTDVVVSGPIKGEGHADLENLSITHSQGSHSDKWSSGRPFAHLLDRDKLSKNIKWFVGPLGPGQTATLTIIVPLDGDADGISLAGQFVANFPNGTTIADQNVNGVKVAP
jgi:hypothetical protein